jgi:predicted DNA-binding transcriptional regulator YafY
MSETTGRLLELLSLLQARRRGSGRELADRLDVTVRTVRRDIDRLRRLGYPIEADAGVAGGYRLGAGGTAIPPLMLDRDEAVAVAVCLRSVAAESIAGGGEAAVRAIAALASEC